MFPVYKSTFERRDALKSDIPNTTAFWRDHMIQWSKDLGRSIDYLGTRGDLDPTRIAYFGFSWGGAIAPVLLAIEERFKAAILLSGGLVFPQALPEADPINFLPRVTLPVLMVNGRFDSLLPWSRRSSRSSVSSGHRSRTSATSSTIAATVLGVKT
jgi:dienelactone hydrolase